MNRLFSYLCAVGLSLSFSTADAQNDTMSDGDRVAMKAEILDDGIPAEACRAMETKLQRVLTLNGLADDQSATRFVLTAKIDVTSKDIVPSTPQRISQKMDVTFMVGDIVENKLYETYTISLAGIGTNETKAFIAAFAKINPQQKELAAMLNQAKKKITTYYTEHCGEIVNRANTLQDMQKYDEAIYLLTSVPNVCSECFKHCQAEAVKIYNKKIDNEGLVLLNKAKREWMKQKDGVGASKVSELVSQINPHSSVYPEVEKLCSEVSQKLQEDEKREWNFQMKKYKDSQAFKRSIVDACKAIGVAWGNGQPRSITKTIIRGWW